MDNKLKNLNKKFISNKTIHVLIENELNELSEKVKLLSTKSCNFFLGRIYFKSNDGSQNTFFYQPTLDTLELKKYKGIDYVLSWKSNGVYNSKLRPLYTAFLHSVKLSGHRIGIKFDKDILAVEQDNYLTKIVNVYLAKKSY